MLAQDHDGNGLIEFHLSGNSGSWHSQPGLRPANWWDTVGCGHEDAYSNALAYRALRGMAALAKQAGKPDDVARYTAAADKLHDAYFKNFYNPATGVLAGWKSADGQLHDYYFLPVNGIAIHYGLVPKDKANAIMDKLLAKMKEVGYTRFDLGLPGNLIPIAKKDYIDCERRWGGSSKEDGSDGFQIYENGGATACHAFFTIAALYDLGRRDEADKILFPMLDSFEKGGFEGIGRQRHEQRLEGLGRHALGLRGLPRRRLLRHAGGAGPQRKSQCDAGPVEKCRLPGASRRHAKIIGDIVGLRHHPNPCKRKHSHPRRRGISLHFDGIRPRRSSGTNL